MGFNPGREEAGFGPATTSPQRRIRLSENWIDDCSPTTIRVMLVDDHTVVRSGLRLILETFSDVQVVGEAGDADSALRTTEELGHSGRLPHVVLMDVNLCGRDEGFAATKALVSRWPDIAVIILTSFESEASITHALRAGAQGYLLKGVSSEVLGHAVKGAKLGLLSFSSSALPVFAELSVLHRTQRTELTARETEIVQFLARSLTNREIATVLFLSEATVKTHVANVLAKLGVTSRQEAVDEARNLGIIAVS